jgi:hypothetical protein
VRSRGFAAHRAGEISLRELIASRGQTQWESPG